MADSQQAISDDQELAKVLAGVGQDGDDSTTALPPVPPVPPVPAVDEPAADPAATATPDLSAFQPPEPVAPVDPILPATPAVDGDLASIKQDALRDLRPLVDKLDIAPDEKFDTYLLLLRSTDDQTLIPQAYDAARTIPDEARKAQALLDVIKEIDYLSAPKQ